MRHPPAPAANPLVSPTSVVFYLLSFRTCPLSGLLKSTSQKKETLSECVCVAFVFMCFGRDGDRHSLIAVSHGDPTSALPGLLDVF
jgi:hypothetical protein